GRYTVSITVLHEGVPQCLALTTALVADAPLVATGVPVTTVEGAALNNVLVATFADTGGPEAVSHYSAVINWGDGHVSAGLITPDGAGGFDVTGPNTYAEEGLYTITVTITDEGGATAVATSTAAVADAPLSALGFNFSGFAGVLLTPTVAVFGDAGGPEPVGNYTVSIDWGDLTPITPGVAVPSGVLFSVSGTHTYTAPGVYLVTVQILDDGGAMATVTLTATIS